MNAQSIEIQSLTLDEKIRLVEDLWDSIADEVDQLPVPDWQSRELHRRKARFDADPGSGKSWADVEQRLREQYGRSNTST